MTHQPKYQTKQEKKEALYLDIFNAAMEAGNKAAREAVCVPMVVSQHQNMADDNSPIEKQWYVADGVCGFGWVEVHPGNCAFAKWLVKTGRGRSGGRKGSWYGGGVHIWSPLRTQSMTRNEAWAHGFAKVVHEIMGIKIYAQSRID